jgi:hypothetical protein
MYAMRRVIVARTTGELVGSITSTWVDPAHRSCEIGWWIGPAARGRGYADETVAAVVPALHAAGIRRVWIGTASDNAAVLRTIARIGALFVDQGLMPLPDGRPIPVAVVRPRPLKGSYPPRPLNRSASASPGGPAPTSAQRPPGRWRSVCSGSSGDGGWGGAAVELLVDDVEAGEGVGVVAVGQEAGSDHAQAVVAQAGEDLALALGGPAHRVGHDLGIGGLCHGATWCGTQKGQVTGR